MGLALLPHGTGQAEDPQTALAAEALRARLYARAVVDLVGDAPVGALLGALRRRYAGRHFTARELEALAFGVDPLLGQMLVDWHEFGDAPGFVISPPVVQRLSDDDDGRPRYQITAHVWNNEVGPGVVGFWCFASSAFDPTATPCRATARVSGHRGITIGIVADGPPEAIAVDTYLARNRGTVYLQVPEFDPRESANRQPFIGVKASRWRPDDHGVVVDDLDGGFAVETRQESTVSGWLRRSSVAAMEMDQGLPIFAREGQAEEVGCSRATSRWSWGRYRSTHARCTGADGALAEFVADLPAGGRWRLHYHIPGRQTRGLARAQPYEDLGQYDFVLSTEHTGKTAVLFDADVSESGWHHVGDFDLPMGPVRLTVASASSPRGGLLLADAVRWDRVH